MARRPRPPPGAGSLRLQLRLRLGDGSPACRPAQSPAPPPARGALGLVVPLTSEEGAAADSPGAAEAGGGLGDSFGVHFTGPRRLPLAGNTGDLRVPGRAARAVCPQVPQRGQCLGWQTRVLLPSNGGEGSCRAEGLPRTHSPEPTSRFVEIRITG